MFVSSYSTYIQAGVSSKNPSPRLERQSQETGKFDEKLKSQEFSSSKFKSSILPFDHLTDAKAQHNKLELQYQKQNTPEENSTKNSLKKLNAHSLLANAKDAYQNTQLLFSAHSKKATTLDQTPKISDYLPEEAKTYQELNMKKLMVNTYIANDRYHQITA